MAISKEANRSSDAQFRQVLVQRPGHRGAGISRGNGQQGNDVFEIVKLVEVRRCLRTFC